MIQYLALYNAMNLICASRINALSETCKFVDDVDLDNDLKNIVKQKEILMS